MKLKQRELAKIKKRAEDAIHSTFRNHAMLSDSYVEDVPALLNYISELEQLLKSSRSGERMWRDLRLEASERIRELEMELEEWNRYKQLKENAKALSKLLSEKE